MKQLSIFEALLIHYFLTKEQDKTEWIKETIADPNNTYTLKTYYKCKKCGFNVYYKSHYCPQCGREAMRGNKNE